jgi:hypothetical protein
VGTGLGTPQKENTKSLEDMEEGRSMKGREVKGEGERVSAPPHTPLSFGCFYGFHVPFLGYASFYLYSPSSRG